MRNVLLCLSIFLFTTTFFAQEKYTVSGYVSDNLGEELTGANIIIKELGKGTVSNYYGYYSLTLPKGNYTLLITFIGYQSKELKINLNKDQSLNIDLEESSEMIESVQITAERPDVNVRSVEMSTNKLQMKTIEKLPVVFGEPDVLKTIQLLPGVLQSSEVSGGFHVRGGSVDQNLILLDQAPVYNASHLVGFFSVFNSSVIKDLKLYKGGIPAEFGGRLSSILDIHMKEGNKREFHGDGGIGTISSKLTLEGPIVKDKFSFVVSGRRTYADLFLPFSKDSIARESTLFFYDLNLKVNGSINEKNKLFLSAYFGRDVLKVGDDLGQQYGNYTTTIRWNRTINRKLFLNTSAIYSDYSFDMKLQEGFSKFNWITGIKDATFQTGLTYYPNPENTIKTGCQFIFHDLDPGQVYGQFDDTTQFDYDITNNRSFEYGIYISNEQELTTRLSIQYGIRFSMFQNVGYGESFVFDKSDPQNYEVTDTLIHNKNKIFNTYNNGWEPRLALRYSLNDFSSVKASYNRMFQYIHLASNSTGSLPLDYWFPSSPNIKPQIADQVAAGYFRNFKENMFETSVEVFYKNIKNSIDFRDHAQLLLNKFYEAELRTGRAWAYGIEFMLKKQQGKLSGWISYTYARTFKQIPEINKGKKYAAAHDKPHDFAIVLSYDISDRWNIAGNWVYTSAPPRTLPTGRFEYGESVAPVFTDRNTIRVFPYHRLDIAATFRINKVKRNFEHFLNFSVYNAYAHHNYISIEFQSEEDDWRSKKAVGTYLYTFVPSISYTFKF